MKAVDEVNAERLFTISHMLELRDHDQNSIKDR